ncbi:MAG: WG repeat-containing protein, partial [Oscillospiraceae bacterium]|nr:WG repeat-containing protein [Oscillospiraceae bacterium]
MKRIVFVLILFLLVSCGEFKTVIKPTLEYDTLEIMQNGYAVVRKDGKSGLIDITQKGKLVVPVEYEYLWYIEDGIIRVGNNGKFGLFGITKIEY